MLPALVGAPGPCLQVSLAIDPVVNLPRGFAHVEYASRAEAEAAIDHMNNGQIDGNVVK